MIDQKAEPRYSAALEQLLRVVTVAAYEAETVEEALELSLQEICEYANWPVGHAMLPVDKGELIWKSAGIWNVSEQAEPHQFTSITTERGVSAETNLIARAARERRPIWVASLADEPGYERWEAAQASGLVSCMVLPIDVNGEVEVVLEFYSFQQMGPDPTLQAALSQIGDQIGVVIKQKYSEQSLRASEERFKALVTNSHLLIAVLNEGGKIKYVSPSVENLLGYAQEQFMQDAGEKMLNIVHPEDLDRFMAELERLRRDPGETFEVKLRARHRNNTWRWLESTLTNHLDHPNVQGIVVNARDVTDRVNTERRLQETARELERSNEELERFAYVASHDLQEPLRMVASYLDLLESRYASQLDEDAREFIDYATDGAERMSRLINDLLAFSRLGTRGKEFEQVDLDVPLQQALRNLEPAIQESGAKITSEKLPTVHGDEGQLMQLFQNLVSNAIKFRDSSTAPEIDIRHSRQGKFWRIEIQDNGIGIEPEAMNRLFVIFTRLHQRHEYGGTGIGLAMSKKIVERHRGAIGVQSIPNEGSTFWFTLPVQRVADPDDDGLMNQTNVQEVGL